MKVLACLVGVILLAGCVTSPPSNTENVCDILQEKRGWYKQVKRSANKWDSDISLIMAFMHQESRFVGNAKPPRRKILWVIPGPRPSNAYGYSQALKSTWREYRKDTGQRWASRRRFSDAADFIGWYNKQSQARSNISTQDTFNLYLAYHEGQGGYNRGTYKNKAWLNNVAQRVAGRREEYRQQLQSCESSLGRRWWWPF